MKDYFTATQKVRLARSLATKTSPAYVQFYITARCNMACEQCNIIYAHADAEEMNLEQIRAMAANMAEIGVCIVLLIGGEPFVRRDLPQIVQAFTDVGIHVRLQTNGLASREALGACVEAGAHDISISLDTLEGALQDTINGVYPESWERALRTVSVINEIFPPNGSAFFGTVLMPRNLFHIPDVIRFATEIGWGVSLVPVHTAPTGHPRGFRSFDDEGVCRFDPPSFPFVREVLDEIRGMKRKGFLLYDSEEYLEDVYRFVAREPVRWRRRNGEVCDSPSLYFAIEPNGNISPCCDYRLPRSYPVYAREFPSWFRSGVIHREAAPFTSSCRGCMYGSYPEISITARYLRPLLERFRSFAGGGLPRLVRIGPDEMVGIARRICEQGRPVREDRIRRLLQAHPVSPGRPLAWSP